MAVICAVIRWSRARSRRSSASVFTGTGAPSGVRKASRCSGARRSIGLKVRMPRADQAALDAVHKTRALAHQALVLAVGTFGILFGQRRNRHHAAVFGLAAQPTEEHSLEQRGVEPIRLGAAMLA